MPQDIQQESSRQAKKAGRDAARRKDRGKKRKRSVGDDAEDIGGTSDAEEKTNIVAQLDAAEAISNDTKNKTTPTSDQNEHNSGSVRKRRKRSKVQSADPSEGGTASKSRFIVFVGNLPYSTTDASLQIHFVKLNPFTLRHRTDPRTRRSKGFAFLEFENYDRMKTCLKLYHHSMFDPDAKQSSVGTGEVGSDGKGEVAKLNGKHARRINVELTAGGGGAKDARKEKIKVKNARLEEQRQRRAELERTERLKSEGKSKPRGRGGTRKDQDMAHTNDVDGGVEDGLTDIHPSRVAQVST